MGAPTNQPIREFLAAPLAKRRALLEDEHPGTLSFMNNLAATLEAQGDLEGKGAVGGGLGPRADAPERGRPSPGCVGAAGREARSRT